jgi:type 1 glutamine amidotransferase
MVRYKATNHVLCIVAGLLSQGSLATVSTADDRPHAVIVVGTQHYWPQESMPLLANELNRFGFRTTIVMGEGDPEMRSGKVLPGIQSLAEADVAILFLRFLTLEDEEFQCLEDYVTAGKPVVGLRTTTHAFKYPTSHPRYHWNDGFGRRVIGTPYIVHQAGATEAELVAKYRSHPILSGVRQNSFTAAGKLYLTRLEPGCQPLVIGTGRGKPRLVEKPFGPIMVGEVETDVIAWTWQNEWGGKVFGTSFGDVGDFADQNITRILVNAVCWAADHPLPSPDTEISTWQISQPSHKP